MLGDHAKREIVTGGDKSASSGRTHSRESGHKHKEESSSSIKSQRRGDKKKKMKKVSTTRPTFRRPPPPAPTRHPLLLRAMSARSIIRCPSATLAFLNALHYFPFP
jgi:hypothetical protein